LLRLITPRNTHIHSLGLLWTRDRSVAETPDYTRLQESDILAPAGCLFTIPASDRSQTFALDGDVMCTIIVSHTLSRRIREEGITYIVMYFVSVFKDGDLMSASKVWLAYLIFSYWWLVAGVSYILFIDDLLRREVEIRLMICWHLQ